MTSTLKLYKVYLRDELNFQVDSIEDYLADKIQGSAITNFQFIKHDSRISIKIVKTQTDRLTNNINYVSIKNENDTYTYYYFVEAQEWSSENALRLELKLDVLNTFKNLITWKNSTRIIREHKDRYEDISASDFLELDGEYDFDGGVTSGYDVEHGCAWIEGLIDFSDYYINSWEVVSYVGNLAPEITRHDSEQLKVKIYSDTSSLTPEHTYTKLKLFYSNIEMKLDHVSEGLTPIQYKQQTNQIEENNKYYLVYRNHENISETDFNQVNPVDCFLIPKTSEVVNVLNTYNTIVKADIISDIGTKNSLIFANKNEEGYFLDESNNTYKLYTRQDGSTYFFYIVEFTTSGGIVTWTYRKLSMSDVFLYGPKVWDNQVLATGTISTHARFTITPIKAYACNTYVDYWNEANEITLSTTLTYSTYATKSFNEIDRTDAKLLKIIECPYCPFTFTRDADNVITFNDLVFEYDGSYNALKLIDLEIAFSNEITTNIQPFKMLKANNIKIRAKARTNDVRFTNDPKLYASDFYTIKFIYDSFNISFNVEDFKFNYNNLDDYLKFNFVMTNTINSRWLFDFTNLNTLGQIELKRDTEDYPLILNCARNNEMTIYSNQYLNYLRNGYNYDVKAKQRGQIASIIGGIGGTIGGASAIASGNVLGGALSVTSAIEGTINNIIQSEANLEYKKAQLQNQATSVGGSDDIDLLNAYSNNQAKLCIYSISDELYNAVDKLFYYKGYASNRVGAPQSNTRRWWDFLQCEAVIESSVGSPSWVIDELRAKYQDGVTIFHKFNGIYNIDQTFENYEVTLYEN